VRDHGSGLACGDMRGLSHAALALAHLELKARLLQKHPKTTNETARTPPKREEWKHRWSMFSIPFILSAEATRTSAFWSGSRARTSADSRLKQTAPLAPGARSQTVVAQTT